MNRNNIVAPVLKWAGGKRQLLKILIPMLPSDISSYCEPFLGGGAMLFAIQPEVACVNDINADLIQMYEVIRDQVEELIEELASHPNDPAHFYDVRAWDRDRAKYGQMPAVRKAARLIYLNKTCYNGLYRVNRAGEFNAPFGGYKNPNIVNADTLRAVSAYFNKAQITFRSGDFAQTLAAVTPDTFVYLDPPYDSSREANGFTSYSKGGFDRDEQKRLKLCCDELDRRGVKFMLSNAATDYIKELYSEYDITIVKANRAINSNGAGRGKTEEVVVRNYD